MTEHELKTWPEFFEWTRIGVKRFEIRKEDRGFNRGDVLLLREWAPSTGQYTGRSLRVIVAMVLQGAGLPGLKPGYVVMGIELEEAAP